MSYGFDFDELDRMGDRHISAIQMKAIAMKMRHKVHGFTVGQSKKLRPLNTVADDTLEEPFLSKADLPRSEAAPSDGKEAGKTDSQVSAFPSGNELSRGFLSSKKLEVLEARDNLLGLKGIFVHPFCIPLVCVPLGLLSSVYQWGDGWTFWLNFLALVPLAKILGDATEELAAAWKNDTLSGLLNATFGNAVELIVSIQSIRAGLFVVVKASLLGSVLSNILLVLGSSFLLGGLTVSSTAKRGKYFSFKDDWWLRRGIGLEKEQKFPVKSAMISIGMLLFACCVIVLPTIFNALPTKDSDDVLKVSRVGSWITMSCYIAYLLFQLITHVETLQKDENMESKKNLLNVRAEESAIFGQRESCPEVEEEDDDEEDAALDPPVAILLMLVSTIVVAINSELLVGTIDSVVSGSSLSIGFIGVILLPIAGNACEHASAIRFAMRDRPGLAIGIAVGSSTQVAMLVVPASVLLAEALGKPLDLDYGVMNVAVLTFTVLVVLVMLIDGRSHWFKGYILVAMYVFLGALYLYVPHGFGDNAAPA